MGVEFGVIQNNLTVGANLVPIPQFPTKLIGIQSAAIYAVAITTPAKQYIIPFGSLGSPVQKYVPCVLEVMGNQLNTYVLAVQGSSGSLIWLFGTPTPSDSRFPATIYAGVIGSLTTNQTSGTASGTITLTFPSGNLKATGIAILLTATGTQAQISFTTSAGTTLTLAGFSSEMGGTDLIVPLSNIVLAQTITVNVTNFSAMTTFVIIYYA